MKAWPRSCNVVSDISLDCFAAFIRNFCEIAQLSNSIYAIIYVFFKFDDFDVLRGNKVSPFFQLLPVKAVAHVIRIGSYGFSGS